MSDSFVLTKKDLTKHLRTFGKHQYARATNVLPLRHAKTKAKKFRNTGTALARVDIFRDGFAVWVYLIPESEQIKVAQRGKFLVVATASWELAQAFAIKQLKKGMGMEGKVYGKNQSFRYSLKFWKMKKIPRPKIIFKQKFKPLTRANFKKQIQKGGGDMVFVYFFSSKVPVRKSPFSNKTFLEDFDGSITLNPSESKIKGKWQVTGYEIMFHIGTDRGTNRDSVDTIAQAKNNIKGMWDEFSGLAVWYNELYAKNDIAYQIGEARNAKEFGELLENTYHSFEDVWDEHSEDYFWEK